MRKIFTYVLMSLMVSLSSCDAWLDVKPYDKMSQDELLSSEAGYIKLLNGIYIELNRDMLYGGAMSVEMIEIMGGADVIPGVSGGTIAFIMGIYDEFVGSIAKIDAEAVRLLFKGKIRDFWKHINGNFLLSIVCGIGVSVVGLAGLMQMLLRDHPIQTWAFFFGLIVASSIFILRGIKGWKVREGLFLVFGVILGIVVCTLSPTETPEALWFIFISGAIAICAMILPGISGSFILLILGKYQFIMGVISGLVAGVDFGRNLVILGVFLIGL